MGGLFHENNATLWFHLASWKLPDFQIFWESKMERSNAVLFKSFIHTPDNFQTLTIHLPDRLFLDILQTLSITHQGNIPIHTRHHSDWSDVRPCSNPLNILRISSRHLSYTFQTISSYPEDNLQIHTRHHTHTLQILEHVGQFPLGGWVVSRK